MRPVLKFLGDELVARIVGEARAVLREVGVEIHNPGVLALLADHGARVDAATNRAFLPDGLLDAALRTAPRAFSLWDAPGRTAHELSGDHVHFTPGSAAIRVLDHGAAASRSPATADVVDYAKVVAQLDNIAFQSTAIVPGDVHRNISDSYRLFLGLLHGDKPVVTGAFTIDAFAVMRDLQVAVRGSAEALRAKPLTIFSVCPTAPLKWSDVTSQNAVDCARAGIPVEYISMPLTGFVSPVTVVGALVEHTAETLSGVAISQLACPGAPALWGGSPASFDIRYETTPMGAMETMLIDCGANEIGKALGLPTQAYMGLSDAKLLDAQAGLETGMGALLAALSGVNSVSGPGMLDFESSFSLEKLVLDNEICGLALRAARGIEPREDFPAVPHFEELLREKHLLIADHTRKHLKAEHYFPGPTIDRANRSRWQAEGSRTLGERAHAEVGRLLAAWKPPALAGDVRAELTRLMRAEAKRFGMDALPHEGR
jgi:trimethylamine--corrinoid protein Co-methyltransferase